MNQRHFVYTYRRGNGFGLWALLLIMIGVGLLLRGIFSFAPWLWPTVVSGAALSFFVLFARRGQLPDLTYAFLFTGWASYAWLDAYWGLPFGFFFVFLGLGFIALYYTATRPLQWPLLPATLLLGAGTFFWIIGLTFTLLQVLFPLILLGLGIYYFTSRAR